MAADTNNPSGLTTDEDLRMGGSRRSGMGRSTFGTLALLVLVALAVIVLLTQCTARVPDLSGLDRTAAQTRLTKSHLKLGNVSLQPSGTQKPGIVDDQAPDPGVLLRTGATVDIILTQGTDLTTVPDVVGQDSANSVVTLQDAGFTANDSETYSDTVPIGLAVWQDPAAGTQAHTGSAVTVYFSLGPQSSAETSVTSNGTGGYSLNPGTTGNPLGTPIFSTARAYPNAFAWSSGGDIYVRLTPGGGTRHLTSGAPWDTSPVVAPNGRYLVFTRASSSGARPTQMCAVSFTSFTTHALTLPANTVAYGARWIGPAVFAPSAGSTRRGSDWIVYTDYFMEFPSKPAAPYASARLLVCRPVYDSTWVSWNNQFRPARTIRLSASTRAGSVRVQQSDSHGVIYDRNFYLPNNIYVP